MLIELFCNHRFSLFGVLLPALFTQDCTYAATFSLTNILHHNVGTPAGDTTYTTYIRRGALPIIMSSVLVSCSSKPDQTEQSPSTMQSINAANPLLPKRVTTGSSDCLGKASSLNFTGVKI